MQEISFLLLQLSPQPALWLDLRPNDEQEQRRCHEGWLRGEAATFRRQSP